MALEKLPTRVSPGFALSILDRAVKELFATRCTDADLGRIRQYFTRDDAVHCAYCDDANPTRWDHIHPVSRGGDTVPGNLVPACARCDDSKQHRDIAQWASGRGKHRHKPDQVKGILDRIRVYQACFPDSPVALAGYAGSEVGVSLSYLTDLSRSPASDNRRRMQFGANPLLDSVALPGRPRYHHDCR